MNIRVSRWLLTSLLSIAACSAQAATAEGGADVVASAMPPGVNPTTPAGGNGGDAAGYDHMPKAGDPPGKTANDQAPEKQGSGTGSTQTPKPKHSGSAPKPKPGASGSE